MATNFENQTEMLLRDMREDLAYFEGRLSELEAKKSEIKKEIEVLKRGIALIENERRR